MTRIEHYYDPNAPAANSIVVAVTAFVLNESGELLMIQRSDNDLWAIPGGAQDISESISETAVREVREETGITVEVTGLVGVYSNPNHVIEYSNGEVRQQFSLCFRARPISGKLRTSIESTHVRWVPRAELDTLNIHPSMRLRIDHGYQRRTEPYIG
jgi:8-oxo-dGTP pyrophosphatase MutT (NUDIX family)